ncbi:MAG TPA: hypothetical protein VG733_18245, partial [Chthoniobacteraceae bacterium]|nr:hypothetical protein [Chthoniobacteraceae bacterium]
VSNIGWLSDIDEHLLTAPPADVTAANAKRLKALGVSKADMKPLLENAWFSPSLQTRFVNDLTHLQGMRGLGNETRLAAHVQSEEQARFLCGSLELLNRYNADTSALHDLSAHGDIPCATNQEGALVAAAPVDVMSWTKVAADFATPPPAGQPPAVFCTNGLLTQSAADGFKAQGWQVLEYPRK